MTVVWQVVDNCQPVISCYDIYQCHTLPWYHRECFDRNQTPDVCRGVGREFCYNAIGWWHRKALSCLLHRIYLLRHLVHISNMSGKYIEVHTLNELTFNFQEFHSFTNFAKAKVSTNFQRQIALIMLHVNP